MPGTQVSRSIQLSAEQAAKGRPLRSTDHLDLYPFPPGKFSHLAVWLWKKGIAGEQPIEILFQINIGGRSGFVLAQKSALELISK
ncbi:MAG: hypothetical protein V1853_03710 [bacterium]